MLVYVCETDKFFIFYTCLALWKHHVNFYFLLLSILSDEVIDDLSKIATWLVQETKSNGKIINIIKHTDILLLHYPMNRIQCQCFV